MDILQINKPRQKIQDYLSIDFWGRLIFLLYVFTLPFVSAFAYSGTITMSVVFGVLLFGLMFLKLLQTFKLPHSFIGYDIYIILLFLFIVVLSFVINGWGNATSFNHTVAYITSLLLFYIVIKFFFVSIADKKWLFKSVLQGISLITILSAVFVNVEFISNNFFDHDLTQYIPRPGEDGEIYRPTALRLFFRARGFAAEPGHYALMMELFTPLTIYYMYFSEYCRWNKFIKALFVTVIVLSFIFAVSTASFVIIPVAFIIVLMLYPKKIAAYIKRQTVMFYITTGIVSAIILIVNYFLSFYALILLSISEKKDTGLDYRQDNIEFFFKKFFTFDLVTQLIGTGPAGVVILGYDEQNAILNLYYSVCFESGFLGLFLFGLLLLYFIVNTLSIKNKLGFFLMMSLLSAMMHFYFVANFWYPWFWFIAAFSVFCNRFFTIKK